MLEQVTLRILKKHKVLWTAFVHDTVL